MFLKTSVNNLPNFQDFLSKLESPRPINYYAIISKASLLVHSYEFFNLALNIIVQIFEYTVAEFIMP